MNIGIMLNGEFKKDLLLNPSIDFWIGVDGGNKTLNDLNIIPDMFIGDFDSYNLEGDFDNVIKLNPRKNFSDFAEAINAAKKINYKNIYVFGFSGNRLDHELANILLIEENMIYVNDQNIIMTLKPGKHNLQYDSQYVSFFTFDNVKDLTLKNFEYELENYNLTARDTLCLSNEAKERASIEFSNGNLIIIYSTEKK